MQIKLNSILIVAIIFILCIIALVAMQSSKIESFQTSNNSDYDIVVAQYKEDVSWLLPYATHVKLYIKSGEKNASAQALEKAGAKVTMLPNVGRESHSYLTYVIDNYDSLPSQVIFTQGAIEPHYSRGTFENQIINMGTNLQSQNFDSNPHHSKEDSFRITQYDGVLHPAGMNYGEFKQKYVKREMPHGRHPVYWGGIFSVKRDRILRRHKWEYQQMIEPLTTSSNPEIGHFFERSWYYIFS